MRLDSVATISPGIRRFMFARADESTFNFIPGQFVNIHFHADDKPLRRSYSIANIPEQSKYIELAIGYIENGLASQYFWALQPGDEVTTSGPFGRLILRDEQPQRYILAATSTGITPYRSMLAQLDERLAQSDLQIVVLLGVRRREDLIYGEEFIRFAKKYPNFSFRAQYSREELSDPEDYEFTGYIQTALLNLAPDPERDIVYLCGNPGMIDASYELLKARGFDVKNVRREKYISAK